jgi:uncharacterized membrane protein
MTVKTLIILVCVFIAVVAVLIKLTYIKPKYKTRPGGIHYKHGSDVIHYKNRPGGVHYITREQYLKNKNKTDHEKPR